MSITSLTSSSVQAGSSLKFYFTIRNTSGNPATTSEINQISFASYTTAVDGGQFQNLTISGLALIDPSTNQLIASATQTGLVTGTTYNTVMSVQFTSGAVVQANSGPTKVLSGYPGQPVATFTPLDTNIGFTLSPATITTITTNCTNGSDASYNGTGIQVLYNGGNNPSSPTQFRTIIPYSTYLTDVSAAGYCTPPGFVLTNTNSTTPSTYECYVSIINNLSVGVSSAGGQIISPTDTPNPPTVITPISTFQYNTDLSGQQYPYTVQDASSVTVLFQKSPELTNPPISQYYIYRTDLSSNGYTNNSPPIFIASIPADISGNYVYPSQGGLTYPYKFVDTSADMRSSNYYGYQIAGYNDNGPQGGIGLPSTTKGVRNGSQASAPAITARVLDASSVQLNVTPPTNLGGFDLSSNSYIVNQIDTSGNVTNNVNIAKTSDASGNIVMNGLVTGRTYSFSVYAKTQNNKYTTSLPNGGIDVSSNNAGGPTLSYNSAQSKVVSLAAYTLPPAPTGTPSAVPNFDASGVPLGDVKLSWVLDTSSNGNIYGFNYYRTDVSSGIVLGPVVMTNPGASVSPLTFLDETAIDGVTYRYKIATTVIYNNQTVESLQSSSTPQVTPFVTPGKPSYNTTPFASGQLIKYNLSGSTSGGLTPVYYDVSLNDASGNRSQTWRIPQDASLNTLVQSIDLSANKFFSVLSSAYVLGPDACGNNIGTVKYRSPINTTSNILTTASPLFNGNPFIDASGNLIINTINNGTQLSFVEGLVIDGSNNLGIFTIKSFSTTPLPSGVTATGQGSITSTQISMNFGSQARPTSGPSTSILVVITNGGGAYLYETLPS